MKKKKKTGFGFSFADPFKKIRMLQGTPKKKKKKKNLAHSFPIARPNFYKQQK